MLRLLILLADRQLLTQTNGSVQPLEATNHEDVSDLYTNTIIVNLGIKRIQIDVDNF